ncbi:sulfotransferase [Flavobacteriaceae bacterium]|nr:sulfotransferase [Flavobacteriaceae bacterium]MDB2413998.1 sulfotransferase [Flavobacteriaceae bacterium]
MNPNFIIVGVARCGTTSLFHYLKQHPDIGMSKIKEPKYFSSIDLNLPQTGVGDGTVFSKLVTSEMNYDELFDGLESFKTIGEGSSDCFYYHKMVIPRIKEKLGDVKIIVCLRNPIERAFSAYNNLVRDSREYLSFSDGLAEEQNRIVNNWDWMWHYKNGGLYAEALEHYQKEFTNVKVVFFEDLESKPHEVLNELFVFLGVKSKISIDVDTRYSHSGKPKSKIVSLLTSRKNPIIFMMREIALKFIPRKYLEKAASKMFVKDTILSDDKKQLQSFFKKDILKLETLLNRDLKSWL